MQTFFNIIRVALSNILNFGSSFIVGFILPLVLTVEDFGNYREFSLYLSQIFILNFGFNDGIYIEYGGKNIKDINRESVNSEHNFILIYQLIFSFFIILISYFIKNKNIFILGIVSFFYLLNSYHSNLFQALNEFKYFSFSNYLKTTVYIFLLIIGVSVLKIDNYLYYIYAQGFTIFVQFLYYEIIYIKNFGLNFKIENQDYLKIFSIGFLILIGNMSTSLIGNVGSIIVNLNYSIEQFAQYSFQLSILNVILLIVNSIGIVFYNILIKIKENNFYKLIGKLTFLFGIISCTSYFVFVWIIKTFLFTYAESIALLRITYYAIPIIITMNILINNLYKTQKIEKVYFIDSILMLIITFLIIVSLSFIYNSILFVAFGTVISYYIFYIYVFQKRFCFLNFDKEDFILIFSFLLIFNLASNSKDLLLGLFIYTLYVIVIIIFQRKNIKMMFSFIK